MLPGEMSIAVTHALLRASLGRHLAHAAAQLEHLSPSEVAEEVGDAGHRAVLQRELGEVAMGDHQLAIGHLRLGQRVPFGDLHRMLGHGRSATVGA